MIIKYNDAEDIYRFIEKKVTYPCNHDDSRPEKKDDDRRAHGYSRPKNENRFLISG